MELIWGGLFVLYLFVVNWGIGRYISRLKKDIKDKDGKQDTKGLFTEMLGFLELLSFAIAWVSGYPAFIVIWVGIKAAGRWGKEEKHKGEINAFLIGNLLCIFFGVIGGQILEKAINFSDIVCQMMK